VNGDVTICNFDVIRNSSEKNEPSASLAVEFLEMDK